VDGVQAEQRALDGLIGRLLTDNKVAEVGALAQPQQPSLIFLSGRAGVLVGWRVGWLVGWLVGWRVGRAYSWRLRFARSLVRLSWLCVFAVRLVGD
jgi:hypothetical protein